MKILFLNIIVIALLLIPVIYGIAMMISGFRIYEGKAPIIRFRASIWDKLHTQYYLYKFLYRGEHDSKEVNKGEKHLAESYIHHGLLLIIVVLGFFLFLFFSGFML